MAVVAVSFAHKHRLRKAAPSPNKLSTDHLYINRRRGALTPRAAERQAKGGTLKRTRIGQLRQNIFTALEDPQSSATAAVIALLVQALIILSVLSFLVQDMHPFLGPDGEPGSCPAGFAHWALDADGGIVGCEPAHAELGSIEEGGGPECTPCPPVSASTWFHLEVVCVAVFTAEYVLRALCTDALGAFVVDPMNVVDLLAIAPFYLELLLASLDLNTQVLRALRLIRLFKMFKTGKYAMLLRVIVLTFVKSASALTIALVILFVAAIVFSSLMWFAEQGEWDSDSQQWLRADNEPSPFPSIPACFWWTFVTFTTCGYGDVTPLTTPGKMAACLAMLTGVICAALATGIVSNKFYLLWSFYLDEVEAPADEPDAGVSSLDLASKEPAVTEFITKTILSGMERRMSGLYNVEQGLHLRFNRCVAFEQLAEGQVARGGDQGGALQPSPDLVPLYLPSFAESIKWYAEVAPTPHCDSHEGDEGPAEGTPGETPLHDILTDTARPAAKNATDLHHSDSAGPLRKSRSCDNLGVALDAPWSSTGDLRASSLSPLDGEGFWQGNSPSLMWPKFKSHRRVRSSVSTSSPKPESGPQMQTDLGAL